MKTHNSPDVTKLPAMPAALAPVSGSASDVIKLYVIEYEHGRNRYHTVIEARDIEAAKRQFRRDNPHVEMLSCV